MSGMTPRRAASHVRFGLLVGERDDSGEQESGAPNLVTKKPLVLLKCAKHFD
jgi:hypothetical protein